MNLKHILLPVLSLFVLMASSCQEQAVKQPEGKIKRESLSVTTKIPGRIEKLLVKEGDLVKREIRLQFSIFRKSMLR